MFEGHPKIRIQRSIKLKGNHRKDDLHFSLCFGLGVEARLGIADEGSQEHREMDSESANVPVFLSILNDAGIQLLVVSSKPVA